MIRTLGILLVVGGVAVSTSALPDNAPSLAALRAACTTDAQQLCAGVQSGGGRIIACLKEHNDALSAGCKQVIAGVPAGSSSGPAPANPDSASASASSANPVGASTGAASASANASSAAKPTHSSAKGGAPGAYLLMKQVEVTDPGAQNIQAAQPAYHLLVPSTWTFKGTIIFGGGKGGCFSDLFGLSMEGKSADGSIVFQGAPDYSWQYADDPAVLHRLNDPNRRALGTNGKPCPVSKPITAEAYFRQNVATLYPSGSTVVSVEAFPELDAIARRRMGLPPGSARNPAAAQTDAIRARIEYQRDGKPVEEWVALAVITRIYPAGHGKFYDCHATDLRAMRAPKGKLDANDKLFKAMISSVQPVPKWQTYSNGMLAKFYQAEAQKEAAQDQIVANLQAQVAATINGVTANMMQGSNNSAFAADQNIRGVQTFRDPATGGTFELSNQYDHAWLNGANEYVMSDDPNFNPNGQVSGNWSQLQAVRPSP
jgi:Cysteine rich repeat